MEYKKLLQALQIDINQKGCHSGGEWHGEGKKIASYTPVDGSLLGTVQGATIEDYELLLDKAEDAFESFRIIPAPKRGELVRQLGNKLREKKFHLGQLVSLEMGKSLQEGLSTLR